VLIISERKRALTEYGIAVNVELMKAQKTQTWLIDELKKRYPDKYIDTSILYKVLTGQVSSAFIVDGINSILNMKE
jgi:hypothetical protein